MGVKYNACPKCQTPKDKLGSLSLPPDLESHQRKSAVFPQKYQDYLTAKSASDRLAISITKDWFDSVGASPVLSIVRDFPHVKAYDLHCHDILHNI